MLYEVITFAGVTDNDDLLTRLEARFSPLFNDENSLLPAPDHVDNNVFGAVPLELYLLTGESVITSYSIHYTKLYDSLCPSSAAIFSCIQELADGARHNYEVRS